MEDSFVDFLPNDGDPNSDITIDEVDRAATKGQERFRDWIKLFTKLVLKTLNYYKSVTKNI